MSNELTLHINKDGTQRLRVLEFERQFVGTKKKMIIYLKNNSEDWPINNITLNNSEKELTFDYPTELEPNEVKEVIVSWNPSVNRRKPLDTKHLFVGELLIG